MRLPLYARIIVWLVPVALALYVAQQNLALFGPVTVRCTADRCAHQLKGLAPRQSETVVGTRKSTGERYLVFTADPLTFDVSLARSMNAATVRMTYQGATRLGIALSSKGGKEYPADFSDTSELIGTLESGWNGAVRGSGMTLFQKTSAGQRVYTTVDEFLKDLPDLKTVGVYQVDLSPYVSLPSYVPSATVHTDSVTLRGNHTLITYVGKQEDLDIRFMLQEANRNKGKDDVAVTVYRNGTIVHEDTVPDDGNQQDGGKASKLREYRLHLAAPGEGEYRVVFDPASDDVYIRSISSQQKYLVWDKKLYLAGSSEYRILGNTSDSPLTIYVRGSSLKITTTHDSSLQTVKVGTQEIPITKRLEQVTVSLDPAQGLIPVTVRKQDLVLETDGGFVLSPSEDFSLYPREMGELTGSDDPAPYAYVLARYTPATHDQSWNVTEHRFDSVELSRNVHVAVSGEPPIASGAASIRVKEIAVTFSGRAVTFSDIAKGLKRLLKME